SVECARRVRAEARRPRGGGGGGGGAVLDDPLLLAVVPDEVRNVVHVRVRAGDDRREADRGQRRERRDAAAVAAVRREEGERRSSAGLDRLFEDVRRQAVDDDE